MGLPQLFLQTTAAAAAAAAAVAAAVAAAAADVRATAVVVVPDVAEQTLRSDVDTMRPPTTSTIRSDRISNLNRVSILIGYHIADRRTLIRPT